MINQKYLWLEILKFNHQGLIPAIIQDADSGDVLRLIKMDKNSIKEVIDCGKLKPPQYTVRSIFYDCDADALLLKVDYEGSNLNWIAYHLLN